MTISLLPPHFSPTGEAYICCRRSVIRKREYKAGVEISGANSLQTGITEMSKKNRKTKILPLIIIYAATCLFIMFMCAVTGAKGNCLLLALMVAVFSMIPTGCILLSAVHGNKKIRLKFWQKADKA